MRLTRSQLRSLIREAVLSEKKKRQSGGRCKEDPDWGIKFDSEKSKAIKEDWRDLRKLLKRPSVRMLAGLGWYGSVRAMKTGSLEKKDRYMYGQKVLFDSYNNKKRLAKPPKKSVDEMTEEELGLKYAHAFIKGGLSAFKKEIQNKCVRTSLEYQRQVIDEFWDAFDNLKGTERFR